MISSQHLINDNLIQNRTFQLMNKGKSVAEKRTQSLNYMIGASIIFFLCVHKSATIHQNKIAIVHFVIVYLL